MVVVVDLDDVLQAGCGFKYSLEFAVFENDSLFRPQIIGTRERGPFLLAKKLPPIAKETPGGGGAANCRWRPHKRTGAQFEFEQEPPQSSGIKNKNRPIGGSTVEHGGRGYYLPMQGRGRPTPSLGCGLGLRFGWVRPILLHTQ